MDYDLLTISELIAYISASAAAILYVIDTLYTMCKKKKNKLPDNKRRRRSSYWQYRRSIRKSPSLSCNSKTNSDNEQTDTLENLMTHPENVVMEANQYENSLFEEDENNVFLN